MTGEVQVLMERGELKTRQPEEIVMEIIRLWNTGRYSIRGVAKNLESIDGKLTGAFNRNLKVDKRTVKRILEINGLY